MLKRTEVYDVPEYRCNECDDYVENSDRCNKCDQELGIDDFYCNGTGLHYCTYCGEELIKEQEEKEKDKPLPGQLSFEDDK